MKIFFLIIVIILIMWMFGTVLVVKGVKEPKYTIVKRAQGYELRAYDSYIVAQVTVKGNQKDSLNQGFRVLAGYIFGGNTSKQSIAMTAPVIDIQATSEKIAMTAPVIDIAKGVDTHTIQFTMPEKYTLETLPKPNDASITFVVVPKTTKAVLRYTLWATESVVASKKELLSSYLKRDGLIQEGRMISAQYNPPLSFPFLRRNEIMAEIKQ